MLGKNNHHIFIKAISDLDTKYMCLVTDMRFRQPITEKAGGENSDGAGAAWVSQKEDVRFDTAFAI